jgi:hypothetical protein
MTAVKAYYDGHVFVPVSPVRVVKNQAAIITILESSTEPHSGEGSPLNDETEETADKSYLQFAGTLSDENFHELTAILESADTIDENEW